MSREKSPSQDAFDDLLKTGVSPIMKAEGYKKAGTNYCKRNSKVSIVVNFQSSHGSVWNEKLFYINIGMAFDEICLHEDIEILERPKEVDCNSRGLSVRIKNIFPQAEECYSLKVNENSEKINSEINTVIIDLVKELSLIVDLPAFRNHKWFNEIEGYPGMKALMYYLLGDKKGASKDLARIAARFAEIPNREKLAEKSYWCKRYNINL
jgi:hypothetical protein